MRYERHACSLLLCPSLSPFGLLQDQLEELHEGVDNLRNNEYMTGSVLDSGISATHCNTLQHTATHNEYMTGSFWIQVSLCNTLQHTATHRNTLQHTATHCNTLQHTATHNEYMTGSVLDAGIM